MMCPRRPSGHCAWCFKRKARRWLTTSDSTPSHTKQEGRCWLCWSSKPGAQRDQDKEVP